MSLQRTLLISSYLRKAENPKTIIHKSLTTSTSVLSEYFSHKHTNNSGVTGCFFTIRLERLRLAYSSKFVTKAVFVGSCKFCIECAHLILYKEAEITLYE